ncbi:MAG: hypothetical protein DRR03_06735, partial [Gammaproteobacteria bacterium]
GPPGAGKTTLVGSYIESRQQPCIWYQLDRGDADIATFFYYLREAAISFGAEGGSGLPLLGPEYLDDIATFSRGFFRQLFELASDGLLLVFDNYHEVPPQSQLVEVFRDGLGEAPAGCKAMVLSRDEPPAALARLRASAALVELGWPELQLTREESDAIAIKRSPELDEDALATLYRRTAGWPAGLVLLLEHGPVDLAAIHGHESMLPQVLFDYLAGEIFEKLPTDAQEFLLWAAVLKRLSQEMAMAFDGTGQGEATLRRLAHGGYFVSERQLPSGMVYEFHPMLREFLLRRVRDQVPPKRSNRWREQAADLLLQVGQVEEAIELLIDLDAWGRAATLIAEHASTLIAQGRSETMTAWFDAFPARSFTGNPWLLYWNGACQLHAMPRESRRLFERSHALFTGEGSSDTTGQILSCAGIIDSVLRDMDDLSLLDPWIDELAGLLQEREGTLAPELEARAACSVFSATMVRWPDVAELRQWLDRAYTLSQESGNPELRLAIEPQVAISIMWTGHFQRARGVLDGLHELASRGSVAPLGAVALGHAEAMYRMLVNDRDGALEEVHQALAVASASGVQQYTGELRAIAAAACLAAGDLGAASTWLDELQDELHRLRRFDLCLYYYVAGWHAQLQGDPVTAYQQQKQALRLSTEVGIPFYEVICRLAMAPIIAPHDEHKCGAHLRKVHALTRNINSHLLAFMALLPWADIALAHGRRQSGLNSLRYAFSLGREHGYYHVLGWQPEMMSRLCQTALEEGIEEEYAQALVRRRGLRPAIPPYHLESWPWPLRIRTLGTFVIETEQASAVGEGKKQNRPTNLLKTLIALGGHEVRAEQVAEAMWPHVEGDYAYRSLNTTLHRLRKLLGDDGMVLLRDGRLSLDPDRCWLDTWALGQVVSELDLVLSRPSSVVGDDATGPLVEQLFTLYRGGFLAGDDGSPQYLACREQWRARFIRCVTRLAAHHDTREQADEAVRCLERAIEVEPASEVLYRDLMISQQRDGRPVEAAATYERCCAALFAAGLSGPTAETRAVVEQVP